MEGVLSTQEGQRNKFEKLWSEKVLFFGISATSSFTGNKVGHPSNYLKERQKYESPMH